MDEAYKFMRSIQENVKLKDDYSVYGENVASRIRGANQNPRAISIAKNRIDNILFQLEMGEFSISDEETHRAKQRLYQFPNYINNRNHPEMYYSSQVTPTQSLDSLSVCTTSSPYPSPASDVQGQPMHSFQTLQRQHQLTPILNQPQISVTETQAEITNWEPHIFNTPEPPQPQSEISLPQQSSDLPELNEFLIRRSNSQ